MTTIQLSTPPKRIYNDATFDLENKEKFPNNSSKLIIRKERDERVLSKFCVSFLLLIIGGIMIYLVIQKIKRENNKQTLIQ